MEKLIKVKCTNTDSELFVKPGTTLLEIIKLLNIPNKLPFISAYVNNKSKDLNYEIYDPRVVQFIDVEHFEGLRVYQRTLSFILCKVVKDLYPTAKLHIKHSIGKGYYFELESFTPNQNTHTEIKTRMEWLVSQDVPILRRRFNREEAKELYVRENLPDKVAIIETYESLFFTVNQLADNYGFFYGTLAPSTSFTPLFNITPFYNGFYLSIPDSVSSLESNNIENSSKLLSVFEEHKKWNEIVHVENVGDLNREIIEGSGKELILMAEALQENMFYNVAKEVKKRIDEGVKIIFISGPSSSGKTTSSNRINIQLRVLGIKPRVIGMDDYFVDRDKTPIDENGNFDFESIKALDTELFNEHLGKLLVGESVEMPTFDFHTGKRVYKGNRLILNKDEVLIIEGIHALNPELSAKIDPKYTYKIYVSALTSLQMDDTSRINTTDNRLLRRIVRDNTHRSHTALDTLRRWGSVRRGEERNIFPYQEEADYMINSSLLYEIAVLKRYVVPLLLQVPETTYEHSEAQRLLNLLAHFRDLDDKIIPPSSVLREFIG